MTFQEIHIPRWNTSTVESRHVARSYRMVGIVDKLQIEKTCLVIVISLHLRDRLYCPAIFSKLKNFINMSSILNSCPESIPTHWSNTRSSPEGNVVLSPEDGLGEAMTRSLTAIFVAVEDDLHLNFDLFQTRLDKSIRILTNVFPSFLYSHDFWPTNGTPDTCLIWNSKWAYLINRVC